LEVRREKLRQFAPLDQTGADPAAPGREAEDGAGVGEFRARQLRARDLLRGELEGRELERHVEESVATTKWERALGWARANSVFPLTFGLACCAIEMISLVTPRYDIARFGAENMRASPRQADLLILSGRVSIKMAPVVRRIYDQMLEPKWAIAMGACSSSGGMFANYAVVQGADKFMPVDVHVPGCPPRPEALISGFNKLQRKIEGNPDPGWRQRYNAIGTEEWARGATGPTQEERDAYTAARELTREMASAPGSDGA
jgi:NADH-quinone oxidoreductase subunit B